MKAFHKLAWLAQGQDRVPITAKVDGRRARFAARSRAAGLAFVGAVSPLKLEARRKVSAVVLCGTQSGNVIINMHFKGSSAVDGLAVFHSDDMQARVGNADRFHRDRQRGARVTSIRFLF